MHFMLHADRRGRWQINTAKLIDMIRTTWTLRNSNGDPVYRRTMRVIMMNHVTTLKILRNAYRYYSWVKGKDAKIEELEKEILYLRRALYTIKRKFPDTASATEQYLKENKKRHYHSEAIDFRTFWKFYDDMPKALHFIDENASPQREVANS